MILFKRVGESFGKIEGREWALLALETIGVVAGILIAFELNAWSARRTDAQTHHRLMERLFEESQLDVAVLRDLRQAMRANVETQKQFVASFSAPMTCPDASLWDAASTIDMYPSVTAPHAVLDEMMASGGLSSITDLQIRKAIALYAGYLEYTARQNEFFRDKHVQVISPDDTREKLTLDPSADEPAKASYDRKALCADQRFRNRMVEGTRNQMSILSYREAVTDNAVAMCALLGKSMGKTCIPPGGALTGSDVETARKAIADS